MEQFANTLKVYLQLLKKTAEFTVDILLDYKTQVAQGRLLDALMYQNFKPFSEGDFVYLLASDVSSLQTERTKF